MFASACLLFVKAGTPALPEHKIPNIFHPLTTVAKSEFNIGMLVFAITGIIFVVVASVLVYTIVRFRARPGEHGDEEPPQVYGSNRIEAAWTVVPILIVFVLAGVSARIIWGVQDASPPPSTLHVEVIGHQYWWEVRYPHYGVVTANEIHVPVAHDGQRATYFTLTSADVIHSLWVPELGGKTDLIPKRMNHMWMDPTEPGIYRGNCTEFCGVQHANMLLEVVVQEPKDFEQWIAGQQKPHAAPAAISESQKEISSGQKDFQMFACAACHTIKGTHFMGRLGPDLTHVMSRRTIASGVLPNTPDNLRAWISNPQGAKPGCLMPGLKLKGKNLDDLTAFIQTLQ